DSVWIEVICREHHYQHVWNLLQQPGYGLTHEIYDGDSTESLIIGGKYPVDNLLNLNQWDDSIDYVRPLFPGITFSGAAESLGDSSMISDLGKLGFKVDGSGIKVGVLSDSYNTRPG